MGYSRELSSHGKEYPEIIQVYTIVLIQPALYIQDKFFKIQTLANLFDLDLFGRETRVCLFVPKEEYIFGGKNSYQCLATDYSVFNFLDLFHIEFCKTN